MVWILKIVSLAAIPLSAIGLTKWMESKSEDWIEKGGYVFLVKGLKKEIADPAITTSSESMWKDNKKNFKCQLLEAKPTHIYDQSCEIFSIDDTHKSQGTASTSAIPIDLENLNKTVKAITDDKNIHENDFYVLKINRYAMSVANETIIKLVNKQAPTATQEFARFEVVASMNEASKEGETAVLGALDFTDTFKSSLLLVKVDEKNSGFAIDANKQLHCLLNNVMQSCTAFKFNADPSSDKKVSDWNFKTGLTKVTTTADDIVANKYYLLDIHKTKTSLKAKDKIKFTGVEAANASSSATDSSSFTVISGIFGPENYQTTTSKAGHYVFTNTPEIT